MVKLGWEISSYSTASSLEFYYFATCGSHGCYVNVDTSPGPNNSTHVDVKVY